MNNNEISQEIKDVKQIPEKAKTIDPSKDVGNYLIQIIGESGQEVIKQLITNKCTIKISSLGEGSTVAEIK